MREIKFRAWDEIRKQYLHFSKYRLTNEDKVIDISNSEDWRFKNDVILEQYTGFTDSVGKDIYEGDKVTMDGEGACNGVVTYEQGCFIIGVISDDDRNRADDYLELLKDNIKRNLKVWGNIHKPKEGL